MLKRQVTLILFVTCILLGLTACKTEQLHNEKVIPEYVFTYAENQGTDYPTTKGAYKFAELVNERTGGRIVIQVKPNAEFGTQQQVVNQMKFGGVDFARVSLSSLSDELPKLNVLQLPFLYEDSDHMWKILDGQIGEEFWNTFEELDLIPLSWYDAGARSFYSSEKPLKCLEDFEGMTIRVQEAELMRDMVRSLGGTPVDIAYSEIYSAFETGKIQAAENNWSSYYSNTHYKVAKYFTVDEHTRVPEIQLCSNETWRILSQDDRQIVLECAKESAEYEKKLWEEQEKVSRVRALSYGAEETLLTDDELEKMRDCVAPLYEKYCSDYMDIIERIKEESVN